MEKKLDPKGRPLYLYRYMFENTDKNHTLTLEQIMEVLHNAGFAGNAHTIRDDIKALNSIGRTIEAERVGVTMHYYCDKRPLDNSELKLIIDAVVASRSIGKLESDNLIQKLLCLTNTQAAEELEVGTEVDRKVKTENKDVGLTVAVITKAIYLQKKVAFQYYELVTGPEKILRREGASYVISPYMTCEVDNRYYVVGWSDDHNEIRHYRADRIVTAPTILDEDQVPAPETFDPATYTNPIFDMFRGEEAQVVLEYEASIRKNIIDRFGADVPTEKIKENRYRSTVTVMVGNTFFGWVFMFGPDMQIMGPDWVVEKFTGMLGKVQNFNKQEK